MKLKIRNIGLVILALMASCEKNSNSFPEGIYLEQVIYHQNVDQINHYYYNKSGLLTEREYQFNSVIAEKFLFQYTDGQISRIDFYAMKNNTDQTLYHQFYLLYEYASGKIIKSTNFPEEISYTYEYDSEGRVQKISGPESVTNYEYDISGNVIKSDATYAGNQKWNFYYEYDTMKNPFQHVDPIYGNSGGVDFISYKCPNNVVKQTFINEHLDTVYVSEYYYTYNDHHLPVESYELFTSESNGYYRDSMHHRFFEYKVF